METYRVRVAKESLTYSSSHFLVFRGGECEALHGHNFRVGAEVEGPLGPDCMVVDFAVLRGVLEDIVRELDHRILVPTASPHLEVSEEGESVRLVSAKKRWILPRGDCVLLPVEATTSELQARWIATRIRERLGGASIVRLGVEIEESPGQGVVCEIAP